MAGQSRCSGPSIAMPNGLIDHRQKNLPLLSVQFLIPMAVSLGFGILFATFITLLIVPINYMVLEDIKRGGRWLFGK